jgi:hypothetical protein
MDSSLPAENTWNWLYNSGMRNSQGLWNDGITSSCQNNGQVSEECLCGKYQLIGVFQTTWTYNQVTMRRLSDIWPAHIDDPMQGVIASGLAALVRVQVTLCAGTVDDLGNHSTKQQVQRTRRS